MHRQEKDQAQSSDTGEVITPPLEEDGVQRAVGLQKRKREFEEQMRANAYNWYRIKERKREMEGEEKQESERASAYNEFKIQERKRDMEEQQGRASATAAALFKNPPSSSLSPTQYHLSQQPPIVLLSHTNLSQQPPLVLRSNGNPSQQPPIVLHSNGNPSQQPPIVLRSNGNPSQQPPTVLRSNSNPSQQPPTVLRSNSNPSQQPPTVLRSNSNPSQQPPTVLRSNSILSQQPPTVLRSNSILSQQPPTVLRSNSILSQQPPTVLRSNSILSQQPPTVLRSNSILSQQPPTVLRSNNNLSSAPPILLPPWPPVYFRTTLLESNHLCPSSNQSTQQYQQPSSSNVNVSPGIITSPVYHPYSSSDPSSNKNYSSSKCVPPMRPEDVHMTDMKRSYASSQNVPPASYFNFKSPAVATNVKANKSTSSRAYQTGLNSGATPSSSRRVPSFPTSTPRSTSTVPAVHNQQELSHPEPPPFHVRKKESNHPCPSSNQLAQQYQQPSSSNVNVSPGNITSLVYRPYSSSDPSSNQNYSSSKCVPPMRPEDEMTDMKRSSISPQDVPPASSFNFKSPAVATNVRANKSTSSRAYQTGLNPGAAPSSSRRVPSCSTSTVPAIHNQQELPHPEPPPFQVSEKDQIPHGRQPRLHNFFPTKEEEDGNSDAES